MHFTLDFFYIYSIVSLSGLGRDNKEKYILNAKKRTNSYAELLAVTVPFLYHFALLEFIRE